MIVKVASLSQSQATGRLLAKLNIQVRTAFSGVKIGEGL